MAKYSEAGIINLFEAVMEQAYADANFFPVVKFKPNNEVHNKKQLQKLAKASELRIEAQSYINGLKTVYGN